MKLKLDFPIPPLPELISIRSPLFLSGSCFAEEIGSLLLQYKFPLCLNPNGILFNPLSILHSLDRGLRKQHYTSGELVSHNDLWHSPDHHGSFSHEDPQEVLQGINSAMEKAHEVLQKAGWLVLTFGSAWVFENKGTGKLAANCHKIPQQQFSKRLLEPAEIISAFQQTSANLRKMNPGLRILLTVSPVRYIRDGLVENNQSKSVLLHAVHQLQRQTEWVYYFPAYEIVNDELRDYRFFKEDMVHPNRLAIAYVWQKFTESCLDKEGRDFIKSYEAILKSRTHSPLHKGSGEMKKFIEGSLSKIKTLQKDYPFLDFSADEGTFNETGKQ